MVDSSQLPVTRSNQDALAFWVAIPLPFTGAGLANRLNDAELTVEPTGIELKSNWINAWPDAGVPVAGPSNTPEFRMHSEILSRSPISKNGILTVSTIRAKAQCNLTIEAINLKNKQENAASEIV